MNRIALVSLTLRSGAVTGHREKDDTVREAMAESLAALASTKAGRDALWKVKAPEVLKKG